MYYFYFLLLICNSNFRSLNDWKTYRASYDTIIMHIPTLVTVTRDSCFAETKNSPEESHHFVSRSVVTTGLFSAAVVIGSSLLLNPHAQTRPLFWTVFATPRASALCVCTAGRMPLCRVHKSCRFGIVFRYFAVPFHPSHLGDRRCGQWIMSCWQNIALTTHALLLP